MHDVTIIVPIHNERNAIDIVYQELVASLKNQPFTSEILFINDGSTDHSEEIFNRLGVRYISHFKNRGYGASIKTGAKNSESPYLCIMDCDSTYKAKDIPRLMSFVQEYPMVVGSRDVTLNPWLYIVGKRFICLLLQGFFGKPVDDINSGLRIIRRDVFQYYEPILCEGFSLTSSLTFAFLLDHRDIHYVPIEYHKRMSPSKIRRWSFTFCFIKAFIDVYRFHRQKLREARSHTPNASAAA